MPFDFGDESINTGDTVGVQCLVNKGDLPMEVRWVLDSSPIVSGQNGISIVKLSQRTSTLNINSVEGMHRGIFKCVVSNAAGTVEHSAELNVNGWLDIVDFFYRRLRCGIVLGLGQLDLMCLFNLLMLRLYRKFPVPHPTPNFLQL